METQAVESSTGSEQQQQIMSLIDKYLKDNRNERQKVRIKAEKSSFLLLTLFRLLFSVPSEFSLKSIQ